MTTLRATFWQDVMEWSSNAATRSMPVLGCDANGHVGFHRKEQGGLVFDGATTVVLSDKPALQQGEWVQFAVACDYRSKRWSLDVNGQRVASDLAFRDSSIEMFSAFGVDEGSTTSASYIDDIVISTLPGIILFIR